MAADHYREVHRRIYDMINEDTLAKAEELIAPNAIDHGVKDGSGAIEGLRNFVTMFRSAFPDLHFAIDQAIVEGNTLASRNTMTGTHKGEFMGAPATGKSFTVPGVDFMRFGADGRVVEHWGYQDEMGFMQQLGLMQPPGA